MAILNLKENQGDGQIHCDLYRMGEFCECRFLLLKTKGIAYILIELKSIKPNKCVSSACYFEGL